MKILEIKMNTYLKHFTNDTDNVQTHLSLVGGKYNVPDSEYETFYRKYFSEVCKPRTRCYLVEKIHNCNFKFFLDIDQNEYTKILETILQKLKDTFQIGDNGIQYIVSSRGEGDNTRYHINFPGIVVNKAISEYIVHGISGIDKSVYNTGLRMLGSFKNKSDKDPYVVKGGAKDWDTFKKTIIRVTDGVELTPIREDLEIDIPKSVSSGSGSGAKTVPQNEINNELVQFLDYMKTEHNELAEFDLTIKKVYATRNKRGVYCYFLGIAEDWCPFKERQHKRASNPVYLQLNINGLVMKCYDDDCKRSQFPNVALPLPNDFNTMYPQLYLSMTSNFWKSSVEISQGLRSLLEDALTGTHYRLALVLFNLYKDTFRVDDIEKTRWFEFNGIRWVRSYKMHTLISSELPRYFNSIRSSGSGGGDGDGDGELGGDDETNELRNQRIDKIIYNLEQTPFKRHILQEAIVMFKNYDRDFYSKLDSNLDLICFENGVYDLKERVFREAKSNDYITFSTGYDYIPFDSEHPIVGEIFTFFEQIMTDAEVREYLLRILARSLSGKPDEKFYIFTGVRGSNGKSTLMNALERALGDYMISRQVTMLTMKPNASSNASPDLVEIRGKRVMSFQEPEPDDRMKTSIIKQLSGGDTVTARELFKGNVMFKSQASMIMCTNDLPEFTSIDGGTWRRVRVCDFNSYFTKNPDPHLDNEFKLDPTLRDRMIHWGPYFMSVLVEYYGRVCDTGIPEPASVTQATNKYKGENDKFTDFIEECLVESKQFGKHHHETTRSIYTHFTNWWATNYPTSKLPDIKSLKRSLKMQFGKETRSGYYVTVNMDPLNGVSDSVSDL